ncbi:MAG TPA: penicillin-binding transpeptidase domain-containing protein, partial [Candidatus Gracilibacteria bacterium]|nr:penicillin-binding transpeptidase domain-containing protein [Candidatus Gracilibacteria bacterium]
GYITEQQMDDALEELQNFEFQKYAAKINAPHFVFYIIEQLEETYGQEVVEQGGLNVYTTIDPKLQEIAETAVAEGAARNTENFNVKNGALVALDPKTGEVLAMVGSKDYFAEDIDGAVNIATQYRQPGSSFKPIVYAQSFYSRYAPASVIFDVRTRFGSNSYPQNYDGSFMGPISIRKALAQSRNIPAIKAYYLAGEMDPIMELAQNMGVKFLDTDREYGWPLALGAAEVQPLSMVASFGTFANGGVYHEPISILKVQTAQGEILEEHKTDDGKEALDPQIAYLINDILSDESVRLGPNMSVSGRNVATKTGTSTDPDGDARDLWTIGYTPNLVAGVWTGNNKADEGKPAKNASGYVNAAPIWKNFMTQALQDFPSEDFSAPEGITTASVSKLTGKLPGPGTPPDQVVEEVFASFSVPTEVDDSVTQTDVDTRNMKLANEYCPPTYVNTISFIGLRAIADIGAWQEGVDAWMEANSQELFSGQTGEGEEGEESTSILTSNFFFGLPPTEESELCTKDNLEDAPKVTIKSPKKNAKIESGINLEVDIDIDSKNQIDKVEYYIDDQFNYRSTSKPFDGTVRLPKGETTKTPHTIRVVVTDEFGYIAEDSVKITTSPDGSGNNNDEPVDEKEPPTEPDPIPDGQPDAPPPEDLPSNPVEEVVENVVDDLPIDPDPASLPTI